MTRSTPSVVLVVVVVALAGAATATGAMAELGHSVERPQATTTGTETGTATATATPSGPGNGTGSGTASVTFDDQTSDGTTVTVASANLSNGGFVVIHDDTLMSGDENSAVTSVVGSSAYLSPGLHENVTVTLDEPISEDQTLVAMPHRDTNDNQAFDFVAQNGSVDGPYTADGGGPVTDSATVTVGGGAAPASIAFDDQTTDGTSVQVASASNDETPYYVAVWTQNESGAPDQLLGYRQVTETSVSNVSVAVDGLNESGTLVAAVHPDADGNASTMDDPVPGTILASDTANVTLQRPVTGASFEVSNLQAPDTVRADEIAVVTATVTNPNEEADTQSVAYRVGGDVVDRTRVALDAGASTTVEFHLDATTVDPGTYVHGVYTDEGGQVAELTVADERSFEVMDLSAPSNATAGETITVDAAIRNPNMQSATQRVEFRLDGQLVQSRNVTLDAGGYEHLTFDVDTTGVAPGTYVHGVLTPDDGAFATITIEEARVASSITFDDQTTDGTSVQVASASNDETPYYVAVWTQNESGAPDQLLGYRQVTETSVSNVSVAVDGLNESGTLVAAVHPDADGNASTMDDPVPGTILASDTANVTVTTTPGGTETSTPGGNGTSTATATPSGNETSTSTATETETTTGTSTETSTTSTETSTPQ
ncbi:MAG: CARDB domain-containing protein [Haloferacaceae archaeon]